MATGIGATLITELLGLFKGTPVTAQSQYALELASDAPDETGACTLLTAGTAPGYSPVLIDSVPASWQMVDARTITNKEIILFPAATTGSWPSVQAAVLRRAPNNTPAGLGDFFGTIRQGRIIDAGERFKILPGGLVIKIAPAQMLVSDAFASMVLGLLQGVNINAPANINVDFGTLDPTLTGEIGKLTGNGYAALQIACNTTNFNDPLNRQIKNKIEFDHTKLFTPTVDVANIRSAEVSVSGVPWIRGLFTKPKSLKAGDNLRLPVDSLKIYG